jgi:hypothetical protein
MSDERLDLEKPRYDQSHFWGRFQHFFAVTNPLNGLATDRDLQNAATLLQQYKLGEEPRGTTSDRVWRAKTLYESAFHPDTGEKQVKLHTGRWKTHQLKKTRCIRLTRLLIAPCRQR